jgi:hypothetical protein
MGHKRAPYPDEPGFVEWVLSRCQPEPNTGCFIWMGATNPAGYPHIRRKGKTLNVHRLMSGATHHPVAMHTCDVPQCCNPDHLIPTTQAANLADMDRKGRRRKT